MQNSEQKDQITSVAPDGSNAFVGGSTGSSKRFVETTAEAVGEEPDWEGSTKTKWWLDTMRPIKEQRGFIAVQTYADKDPNDFVKCDDMSILFNDQAEYYFVCKECFFTYKHMQWCGSTRGSSGWRERAEKRLEKHKETKGWCEFCDPVFGNGGWML